MKPPPHLGSDLDQTSRTDVQSHRKHLAGLVPLWPGEIDDRSRSGRLRLIAVLERALRAERRRGLAGHWTYDLARHIQLLDAYRAETRALRELQNGVSENQHDRETKPKCNQPRSKAPRLNQNIAE